MYYIIQKVYLYGHKLISSSFAFWAEAASSTADDSCDHKGHRDITVYHIWLQWQLMLPCLETLCVHLGDNVEKLSWVWGQAVGSLSWKCRLWPKRGKEGAELFFLWIHICSYIVTYIVFHLKQGVARTWEAWVLQTSLTSILCLRLPTLSQLLVWRPL